MVDLQFLRNARAGDLVQTGHVGALVLGAAVEKDVTRLALLVGGGEARRVHAAVRGVPGLEVAVFTPTGSGSGSFSLDVPAYSAITIAIMPVDLAEGLLSSARYGGALSPTDRERVDAYITAYFRSLARLVGISDGDAPSDRGAEDARRAALDEMLNAAGWRPPHDMLERLALADPWIREGLLSPPAEGPEAEPGLTAFFVRERAVAKGFLDCMRQAIEDTGFEILASVPLAGEVADEMRKSSRGGNWGRGPFLVSGGPPRHLFFAFDAFPVAPKAATIRLHPLLDNARALDAKRATRELISSATRARDRFNPLHSSDHSAEAFRLAEKVLSEAESTRLKQEVEARRAQVQVGGAGAAPLPGRNVTAACLRVDGIVRRVFRPHLAKHVAGVVETHGRLSSDWPELPEIVGTGEGFVDFADPGVEFVPAATMNGPLPLPLAVRLRTLLMAAARSGVVEERWDPLQAVLVDLDTSRLRLLGFDRPRLLETPQTLSALLADRGTRRGLARLTGIPTEVFLHGTAWQMRLARDITVPIAGFAAQAQARASRLTWAVRCRIRRPS